MQLPKLFRLLWGDLSADEIKKFSILSVTFLFLIGSYSLLRPIKYGVFVHFVGIQYQPIAKIASMVSMIFVVSLYSKLVDMFSKDKLFYVVCIPYGLVFGLIAFLLAHPTLGVSNRVASPDRYIGWAVYLIIESFGPLMLALFWSFVASNTTTESAKRGYPLIIFGSQFGAIAGPTLASLSHIISLPILMLIATSALLGIIGMIRIFMCIVPHDLAEGVTQKEYPKTGVVEGVRLLLSRPYVAAIFGITVAYEVIDTLIDYRMKVLASSTYSTAESYTQFMGQFGQCANFLALLLALFGTSAFIRRYGLSISLLVFPVVNACMAGLLYCKPELWAAFTSMLVIRGFKYAINDPVKEIMYIPTSRDIKFKSKSWIDTFGSRFSEALGSFMNHVIKGSVLGMVRFGCLLSFGIVGMWVFIAMYVGRTFNKLTSENKIVE